MSRLALKLARWALSEPKGKLTSALTLFGISGLAAVLWALGIGSGQQAFVALWCLAWGTAFVLLAIAASLYQREHQMVLLAQENMRLKREAVLRDAPALE